MAPDRIRTIVACLSIASLAAVFACPARADYDFDDPKSTYEINMALTIVRVRLAEALKTADTDTANAQLEKLPALWKKAGIKGEVGSKALKFVGDALLQAKLGRVRPVALQTILDCDDPESGWVALKPSLPKNEAEDTTPFHLEILKAAGTLRAEGAVDTLLTTVLRAKSPAVAAEAATALGQYSQSKQRERILAELVKHAKTMKPGAVPASPSATAAVTVRWDALKGPIAASLDALTGTTGGDLDAWIKRVDEAKGALKPLFKS